jgi:1,4-alpha-glucan branching enzyme
MGILLKANDWPNGQTTDYIANLWDGTFQLALTSPLQRPLFVTTSEVITISAETPVNADFDLFINNVLVHEVNNTKNFNYLHTVTEVTGYGDIRLVAQQGPNVSEVQFQYLLPASSPAASKPAGIIQGINYSADNTRVTLCLLAPGKTSVYVRGDFSNWDVLPSYLMNRDGELFWIELTGLTPGQEYGFQYLVDQNLWLADPYADKILDPDDQYIPSSSYPALTPYPTKALAAEWYFNRVSIFQTGQTPYAWQAASYMRPPKEKLVIYELLLRDFFDADHRNYQTLKDTLSYFKKLGITAIELMPIMEFNGNESWGYNPTFMFAPDKYYGTKNKLKEFIDACHLNGIAVILDIALNHQDLPNPLVMMDFDFSTFKPKPSNKWFNENATHPFNVFYDMNHESAYTKAYLDTITYYWLNEFKVDGFRFDLSKGFTQVNNPNNVTAWSAYDPTRVAILKRMADKIWSHTPDAYIILEHFAANSEERELAEYKASEGKGMMLWGNHTYAYSQNAMGYSEDSDISGIYHGTRGWTVPHLVGYMESHDEERMMYKNLQFGKTVTGYNTKNLNVALNRMKAAATLFYTIPGPKMLWQFGELGYDYSINHCPDGSISNDCRISNKPVTWEYRDEYARYRLYEHIADLIRLRNTYLVFNKGTPTLSVGNNLVKQITLKNTPYTATPTDSCQMNVQIAVNFDVVERSVNVTFPHTGVWYDYYASSAPLIVSTLPHTAQLKPGEFKIFTDVEITYPIITSVDNEEIRPVISVYPNPAANTLFVESDMPIASLSIVSMSGIQRKPYRLSENSWDLTEWASGIYVVLIEQEGRLHRFKLVKH